MLKQTKTRWKHQCSNAQCTASCNTFVANIFTKNTCWKTVVLLKTTSLLSAYYKTRWHKPKHVDHINALKIFELRWIFTAIHIMETLWGVVYVPVIPPKIVDASTVLAISNIKWCSAHCPCINCTKI